MHIHARLIILFLFLSSFSVHAQLQVTNGGNAQQLVEDMLLGAGITASNVTLSGAPLSIGTFTTGTTPTNLGLSSGLILSCGTPTNAIGPNNSGSLGTNNNTSGIHLLDSLANQPTFDACVLEFDFVPQGDTMRFRYVFGSEEYPEFVIGLMNDIFGFFVSGTDPEDYSYFVDRNIAIVPGSNNVPVSIGTINNVIPSYPQYYVDNTGGVSIQYDGFTTVLTAWIRVVPCSQYHIKLAIADGGDHAYDSGVFLEEGSFTSGGIQSNISFSNPNLTNLTAIEGCNDAIVTFKLPNIAENGYVIPFSIGPTSTAIFDVDYDSLAPILTIPPGSDSASLIIHPLMDGITEGPETVVLIIPNTICMTSFDTIYFTILDYTNMSNNLGPPDTLIQCGTEISLSPQFSGGIGPFQYAWNTGYMDDTLVITPGIPTQYTLSITDVCNYTAADSIMVLINGIVAEAGADTAICSGGLAQLLASGGTSYVWSNGATTASLSVSPTVTTDYIVTVTDFCSDIDTVRVVVNPLPVVQASGSVDSICPGETVVLQASGAASYVWQATPADPSLAGQTTSVSPLVSPMFTTTYTLIGTDNNTCVNQDQVVVYLKSFPSSDFMIHEDSICVGQTTLIEFEGTALSGSQFNWTFDGGQTLGSGAGPIHIAWTSPGWHPVSLQVIQTGCPSPVSVDSVLVIQIPVVDFTADQTEGCPPMKVQFMDLSSNVIQGATYEWSLGNGQVSSQQHPWFEYTRSGVYSIQLVISNQYGCADTLKKTAYINIYPVPNAQMSVHPDRVSMLDPTVKFYDRTQGIPAGWLWDFGDLSYSQLQNTIHTYQDTGVYLATLYVTNDFGCKDTVSSEIIVYPDNTLYFPSAFSPNADNHNDFFDIKGTNITDFQINIYNRWGIEVFQSSSLSQSWDGRYDGKDCPPDVYIVRVKYRDALGGPHSYYGHVLLMK